MLPDYVKRRGLPCNYAATNTGSDRNLAIGEDTNGDRRSEAVNKAFDQFMLQYQWSLDSGH
ncbi:hypothetical protein [Thiothrix winogradskyi]|uniref:Uncharacterized protein n=1 Tax=Thiothrix winogradskyi TaxID=96472 RepID=A0ABY3SXQ7_9GAMM|nr:hypothetical protein [Thiothrix winogradskyi]UJS23424.1 hypothetical protein L2Y54_15935 [Thiothrix winogradskyi]